MTDVLVTGSTGYIGRNLLVRGAQAAPSLRGTDKKEVKVNSRAFCLEGTFKQVTECLLLSSAYPLIAITPPKNVS